MAKGVSSMEHQIPIFYVNEARSVVASHGESVLSAALAAHIQIPHSCGGMGTCGTCRFIVRAGLDLLEPRNEVESEMAMDRGFRPDERLACQSLACEGLHFELPIQKV